MSDRTPWSVAMGFETRDEYDARPDDHPGDDSPFITEAWG